jgi:hypothetical protein
MHWIELKIPSPGIPLQDKLQIDVLSKSGEKIGCLTASLAEN